MGKYLYGIDFGTSNSVLSIYNKEIGEIIDTISVPSILYFPAEHDSSNPIMSYVGKDAIHQYINEGMKGRFMKSIKRVLPNSSFVDTRVHSQKYTASDLVTIILKDLKSKADAIIGEECVTAVMGRPVFFDDNSVGKDELAQKRLLKAAENAGFENIRFQFEPIGAAFVYEKTITKKERVLVADLGGGTTDFTVIQLDPEKQNSQNRRDDIKATGGIYIGGDSFDSAFMWNVGTPYFGRGVTYESAPDKFLDLPLVLFLNICSWEKMNFFNRLKTQLDLKKYYDYTNKNPLLGNLITLTDNNLGYSVFQEIEKTKVELSNVEITNFKYSNLGIEINKEISVTDFNNIIDKDITKISEYLDEFLVKNNISVESIDSLFLTGGSSMVAAVQELFKDKFPNITINSGDNFISVAKGLAYCGYLFDE